MSNVRAMDSQSPDICPRAPPNSPITLQINDSKTYQRKLSELESKMKADEGFEIFAGKIFDYPTLLSTYVAEISLSFTGKIEIRDRNYNPVTLTYEDEKLDNPLDKQNPDEIFTKSYCGLDGASFLKFIYTDKQRRFIHSTILE